MSELKDYLDNVFLDLLDRHNLGVQTRYDSYYLDSGELMFENRNRIRQNYRNNSCKTREEVKFNLLRFSDWQNRIYFEGYEKELFETAYLNATPEFKKIMQKTLPFAIKFYKVPNLLSSDLKELKIFIKEGKKFHNIVKNSLYLNHFVEGLKNILPQEDFDEVIFDFLKFNEKSFKSQKSKINIEYVLKNYIDNEEILNYFNLLDVKKEDQEDIFNEDLITYEILVDKKKITNLISLENLEHFSNMYNYTADFLSNKENIKLLQVNSFKKDDKYKSAKNFSFLFRVDKNSKITQEYLKKIVIETLKEYYLEYKNSKNCYQFGNENLERMNKIILNASYKEAPSLKKLKI